MMMPVGLILVRSTSSDPKKVAVLASLLLFSIAYGSAMGSIGTPSGGGRNVIMMGYWTEFGHGTVSYLQWMKHAYPMLLFPNSTGCNYSPYDVPAEAEGT